MRRIHRRLYLTACAICWIAAAVATHIPAYQVPHLGPSDKTLHFFGYLALTAVTILTLRAYGVRPQRRVILLVLLLPIYGALDELTQPLFGRCAAWQDWLANVTGISTATLLDVLAVIGSRLIARRRRGG